MIGVIRDRLGRRVYTYKALDQVVSTGDYSADGTIFDANGREQVCIVGISASSTGTVARSAEQTYSVGRIWHTNFLSANYDAAAFDILNLTRITDSSLSAVQAASGTEGTVFLKAGTHMRNFRARLRYRTPSASPHTSSFINLYGRYLASTDNVTIAKGWNPAANGPMQATGKVNNSSSGGRQLTINNPSTDYTATTPRIFEAEVIEDMVRVKDYVEGSAVEPDWTYVGRMGFSNPSGQDNPEFGIIGFGMIGFVAQGWVAFDFTIQELVRADDNLLYNAHGSLLDGSGVPVWWSKNVLQSGNTLTTPSVADRLSDTKQIWQATQTVDNAAITVGWVQTIYNIDEWSPNSFGARTRWVPVTRFGPIVEASIWSKGTTIAFLTTGTLGACFVFYYYDRDGNVLNLGDTNYFRTLGPNALGIGTWDWTQTVWRMPLVNWQRIFQGVLTIGLHDQCSGTLQWTEPSLRIVA